MHRINDNYVLIHRDGIILGFITQNPNTFTYAGVGTNCTGFYSKGALEHFIKENNLQYGEDSLILDSAESQK